VKTIVILLLILLTIIGAAGCAPDTLSTIPPPQDLYVPPNTPGVHAVPAALIYFDEVPDIVAQPGDNVEIHLTFTNYDSETRIMKEFPPQIDVQSRNIRYINDIILTFPAGREQPELQPGESQEYSLVWDQKDISRRQVP
jgi:hypothetical protein